MFRVNVSGPCLDGPIPEAKICISTGFSGEVSCRLSFIFHSSPENTGVVWCFLACQQPSLPTSDVRIIVLVCCCLSVSHEHDIQWRPSQQLLAHMFCTSFTLLTVHIFQVSFYSSHNAIAFCRTIWKYTSIVSMSSRCRFGMD